jgi:hypothetical protein
VSADGLYWTTAAIAPDTTVKTLPIEYADRIYGFAPNAHFDNAIAPQRGKSNPEGVRTAPGGHIWDKAIKAGVSLRNYGFMAINLPYFEPDGIQILEVEDPVLAPYTNMYFRQHDRSFPDVQRMHVIFKELDRWERTGNMPQLILITIGNDHTPARELARQVPAWQRTTRLWVCSSSGYHTANSGPARRFSFSRTIRRMAPIMWIRTVLLLL